MKPLWEQEDFQRVAGEIWRPGGPELTRRALELAARRCGLAPGARLLDLGCGPGASLELLAGLGYRPLGLDRRTHAAWAKRAAGAERSPAVIFLQGDAACPPLADNSVDGVLSECVLSLLPDPLDALRGCRRTLRPGGALLLSDLSDMETCWRREARAWLPRNPAVWPGHVRVPSGRACLSGPVLYRVVLRTTAGRWSKWRHGCSGMEPTPRPNGCAAAAPAAVGAGLSATACG